MMAPHLRLREPQLADGFVKGRVSVIMPAYNEANCIEESVAKAKERFEPLNPDYEIIVVDDGSTDATKRVVQALSDEKVRYVGYSRNEGKGFAFKKGFHRVTGEFTFLVDGDSEIWGKELHTYLEALKTADIVVGSKRHPLSTVRTPPTRKALSLGFNVLERLLTGIHVTDTQAGFKAARSLAYYRILPLVTAKRFAFDLEILSVASLLGLKVKELPVSIDLKASVDIRSVFRMLIDTLGIAYRLRIRKWYQANVAKMADTYRPLISW
ncbi:MAG TPA: glycosyltransferase [Candidatus Angelobacter sp.]|nr:glycosyltransferase [Candidatus Angelobacter sp.]